MKKVVLITLVALCVGFGASSSECIITCKIAKTQAEVKCKQSQNCHSIKDKNEAEECKSRCSFEAEINVFNPCFRVCMKK